MCFFQTNQTHAILNPDKQERQKNTYCKRSFALLEDLLKPWGGTACLPLTNKTSVIFIGNKYLII